MRTTILVENSSPCDDLIAEHGLAIWIETDAGPILFDTGASGAVAANANRLGIDLSHAVVIVISHGHYDHAGGLVAVARINRTAPICMGESATIPKYSVKDTELREIGFDREVVDLLRSRFRYISDGEEILPGVVVAGSFGGEHPLPVDNQRLLREIPNGHEPDPFDDERALVIREGEGAALFTGCSHRGIGNIVSRGKRLAALHFGVELSAVVGGFHLHKEDDKVIRAMAKTLSGVRSVRAGHCTGDHALSLLASELGKPLKRISTGQSF